MARPETTCALAHHDHAVAEARDRLCLLEAQRKDLTSSAQQVAAKIDCVLNAIARTRAFIGDGEVP